MLISPRPKNFVPDIYFNGSIIQRVSCVKYLGMYIDDKLSFVPQVNDVCTRLSRFQGITYSLAPFIPQNILLNLYNSLIYPIFTQHIIIWGCLPQIHVNKITVVINNILRNILRVHRGVNNIPLVSTNYLYNTLGLLKFTDTYKLFILKFIHLVFYDRVDLFIDNFSEWLPQGYTTRNRRINLPVVRTEVEKRSVIFQCCRLIQSLPEDLLQPQSKSSLNVKFRKFAISKYN